MTSRSAPLTAALNRLHFELHSETFPHPNAVVVSSSELSENEKALILFRHSKSGALDAHAKFVVTAFARMIISTKGFTPERIRRFVSSSLPKIILDFPRGSRKIGIHTRINEELRDPTKQMRTSFLSLNDEQRQVMISMLDCKPGRITIEELESVRRRHFTDSANYETSDIVKELDEHFLQITTTAEITNVDWIHPSWRDLVVEHLLTHRLDRLHFLSNCLLPGIKLAISTEGGYAGERRYPLLVNDEDLTALKNALTRVLSKNDLRSIEDLSLSLASAVPTELPDRNSNLFQILEDGLDQVASKVNQSFEDVSLLLLESHYRLAKSLRVTSELAPEIWTTS